jgi:hypothetical protein
MICIDTTNTLGATASKFWKCDSSGANCTSADWPDDGCGAGKLSCTGADCVVAAAPALAYNASCKDLKAADLTSAPPNLYKINGPGGVNLTDAFLFEQGGLSKLTAAARRRRFVVATGRNSSGDFLQHIGNTADPCVPAMTFRSPTHREIWRLHDPGGFGASGPSSEVLNATPPVTYRITGDEPPGWHFQFGGRAEATGIYTFYVTAIDAKGCTALQTNTITVLPSRSSTPELDMAAALVFGRH